MSHDEYEYLSVSRRETKMSRVNLRLSVEVGLPLRISTWKLLGQTTRQMAVAPACGAPSPAGWRWSCSFPWPQQGWLPSCPPKPRHPRQAPLPHTGPESPWHEPASGSALAKLGLLGFRQHLTTLYFHIVLIHRSLKRKKRKERNKTRKIWFGCLCYSVETWKLFSWCYQHTVCNKVEPWRCAFAFL